MVVVPRFSFSTVRSQVLVKREIRAQSKFLDWDQNIRQGLGRRSNESFVKRWSWILSRGLQRASFPSVEGKISQWPLIPQSRAIALFTHHRGELKVFSFFSLPFPSPPPPSPPVGRFIRALKTFHHRHWFDSGWNHSEMVIIITGSHQLFCSRKFFKWNCCQTWFGILWCFFERFIWPKVVRWLWHQLMLNSYECKFQSDVHADMFSFFRSPIRAI